MNQLSFRGFIRDVKYVSCLTSQLDSYDISQFDINKAKASGIITLDSSGGNNLAFSKWVSPKRTRSYPFGRLYDTAHLNTKRVAIIPIIKDEGKDGDNDRINFITFSWMNLLNIYIILSWYDDATKKANKVNKATNKIENKNKITNQKFNNQYIIKKILELSTYQATALHWNTTHFENEFETIYQNAVTSYQRISQATQVILHSPIEHLKVLESFKYEGMFSLNAFKERTLPKSYSAANREILTTHRLEYLQDSKKGIFFISNYLGGEYHLTADEIYSEGSVIVIQESKNSDKGKFPKISDIKDGLFKLILFINLQKLFLNDVEVEFITKLKLTGKIIGSLTLPSTQNSIDDFSNINKLRPNQKNILTLLNQEMYNNSNVQVLITGRNE